VAVVALDVAPVLVHPRHPAPQPVLSFWAKPFCRISEDPIGDVCVGQKNVQTSVFLDVGNM